MKDLAQIDDNTEGFAAQELDDLGYSAQQLDLLVALRRVDFPVNADHTTMYWEVINGL